MTQKKTNREGIYSRTITRDGRSVTVFDAVFEAPRKDGHRKKTWHRGFATQREAVAWRNEQRMRVQAGAFVAPHRTTVAAFLDEWLPSIRATVRPSTFASYSMHVHHHISPRIGSIKLQHLTVGDVSKLYGDLSGSGLSPASVQRIHATLHRALRDARRRGRVVRNVAEDADRPKVETPELSVWSPAEVRRFLAHASDHEMHALFATIVSTGLRRGEALALTWGAVDLDSAALRVTRALVSINGKAVASEPKTKGSRRAIALDANTVAVLRRHRAQQSERRLALGQAWSDVDVVFDDGLGRSLPPDRVSRTFAKLVKEAKVPPLTVHGLRHCHASFLLLAGVHPKIVSERLGHSNVSITLDTYSHLLGGLDDDAATKSSALVYGSAEDG